MSRRRSTNSIVANPVLVGAVTTLVVVVAVFLAYNANNGLPFVPTTQLKVDIANGSELVKGNDVREGGYRIGVLSDIKPIELPSGVPGAQLTLKLDRKTGKIPVDSTIKIRARSVLGLKYVELTKGTASKVYADGATLPLAQTNVPVQFDDVLSTFNAPTRRAGQVNLEGFGDALAGRGENLSLTIASLPALFGHLTPVAANLADPHTELARLFRELGRAARIVAPVAGVNSRLFTDLGTTFEAFSRSPQALKDTIAKSPPTLDVGTTSLRVQRPFLVDLTRFGRDFAPATAELRAALPDINPALEIGAPVLRRSVTLNAKLQGAMGALRDLARAPTTDLALRALTATVATLNPQLRFLGPYVTVCNNWNYFWTYVAEHLSEEDPYGYAERTLLNSTSPSQTNSEGTAGATEPVNGGGNNSDPRGSAEFLHGQGYGAAVTPSGAADCEVGQRGYPRRLATYGASRFNVVIDPHTPGVQGPTFAGSPRVPRGETFTREPQTGPQLAPTPGNP